MEVNTKINDLVGCEGTVRKHQHSEKPAAVDGHFKFLQKCQCPSTKLHIKEVHNTKLNRTFDLQIIQKESF
jgi:hypothetical protein